MYGYSQPPVSNILDKDLHSSSTSLSKTHSVLQRLKITVDYIACTVEMIDFHAEYDVAVID